MDTEKKQKYFVSRKKTVTIKCLACGKVRTVPVENLNKKSHSLTINCPCTKTFEVDLEFRHDYRQKSHIVGSFRAYSSPKERSRRCVIADQSLGGLLLHVQDDLPIKHDDRLIVSYPPDSGSLREIERVISVRHYTPGSRIGGAFVDAKDQFRSQDTLTATA